MILLKSPEDIALIAKASQIVAEILDVLEAMVRPGVTTEELDRVAEELTLKKGARPAFKGYSPQGIPYPKCLCVSVNDEIVHGIPSARKLREGDIVGLDFGVVYQGFYGDAARTVPVGKISERAQRLIETARNALYAGIEQARVGNRLSDIATAIESYVTRAGFSVVEEFTGHGIGRELHEEPQVPNYFRRGMRNPRLKEGMTLAIEPMVNEYTSAVRIREDGWTAATADGGLSAHFEHSVAITADGPRILSRSDNG